MKQDKLVEIIKLTGREWEGYDDPITPLYEYLSNAIRSAGYVHKDEVVWPEKLVRHKTHDNNCEKGCDWDEWWDCTHNLGLDNYNSGIDACKQALERKP